MFVHRLSIEARVKTSTPRLAELSMLNPADIRTISCGEKHLMMLCSDGVSTRLLVLDDLYPIF